MGNKIQPIRKFDWTHDLGGFSHTGSTNIARCDWTFKLPSGKRGTCSVPATWEKKGNIREQIVLGAIWTFHDRGHYRCDHHDPTL